MKNSLLKAIGSFLVFAFVAAFFAQALSALFNPVVTIALLTILAFTAKSAPQGMQLNGISREIWVDYIIKRFWKDNAFLKTFYSDDQYVIGGKTVHIPQPGTKPQVIKNPSSFPLTATQRTDTEISYDLDFYATAPTFITSAEAQEISYDKMDSVLGDHLGVLNERAADELVIKQLASLPGTSVIYTSGPSLTAYVTGQTGNRKAFNWKDLSAAQTIMDNQNIPQEGRFALLTANAVQELTDSMTDQAAAAFRGYYDPLSGRVGKAFGFNVFMRSDVAMAAAALSGGNLAVNAYGASVAATDGTVCLCYHTNACARAMGEILIYDWQNSPMYTGDVYNASIRFGGRRRRDDDLGIVAIQQGTPS